MNPKKKVFLKIKFVLVFNFFIWNIIDVQYCVSFRWYLHGFPGRACVKEPACQCRKQKRQGFNPWVRKIPWRRKWQPSPVFLPGESHGPRSLACRWGHKESDTIEWLNSNTTFLDCCLVLWRGLKSGMNYVDIWWFHSFILFLKREKQNWNYGRRF